MEFYFFNYTAIEVKIFTRLIRMRNSSYLENYSNNCGTSFGCFWNFKSF